MSKSIDRSGSMLYLTLNSTVIAVALAVGLDTCSMVTGFFLSFVAVAVIVSAQSICTNYAQEWMFVHENSSIKSNTTPAQTNGTTYQSGRKHDLDNNR